MQDIFLLLAGTALVNNIIVEQLVGSDPALTMARRMDVARCLAGMMVLLLPLTTMAAALLDQFILVPLQLEYLRTLAFILVMIAVCYGLRAWRVNQAERLLPFAGINTMVLGTLLLNPSPSWFLAFFFGLGTAVGFGLVLLMLAAISERLLSTDLPAPLRGPPIILLTLGLIGMACLGFTGVFS